VTETVFTLRELAERIGATVTTVKFWADHRAIRPQTEHAGRGVPRMFSLPEARVASMLAPFAQQGLTIGTLVWLGGVFRRCFAARQPDNPDSLLFRSGDFPLLEALDQAISGEEEIWMAVVDIPELRDREELAPSGWRPIALLPNGGEGIRVQLDALIPTGLVDPHGRHTEIDRSKSVVMIVNLTARLSLVG
jgi:hypothetical protein